ACDVCMRPLHAACQPLRSASDLGAVWPVGGLARGPPSGGPRVQREPAAGSRPRARARIRVRPPPARANGSRGSAPAGWEGVIGLEIHVQLSTRSKMFCRCPNESGGEPNTRICPACTAQPGALPVANRAAVERTIAVGLALGSEIAPRSTFHRKN